jgi:SAM-dependent methyltransferase
LQNEIASHYDKRGLELMKTQHNQHSLRHDDVTRKSVLKVTESYLRECREGRESILDLCCGVGTNSVYPAQLGYKVLGVDLSPKSIEACSWLMKENGVLEKCEFRVENAIEYLTQTKEKFDVIQIYASLYYFNRVQVLELIRDRLRLGGRFICVETSGSQPIANFMRWLKNPIVKNRDQDSMQNLTRVSDLDVFFKVFPKTQITYLDFLSYSALPLKRLSVLSRLAFRVGTILDQIIFQNLGLRFFAFKFVILSEL